MRSISIVRSLYFKIFSTLYITFLSPAIALSINMPVPFSLSRIIMSGFLLWIVLSVCTCWFYIIVIFPRWVVTTGFGICSFQCFLSTYTPISLYMLKCICALNLSCRFTYCFLPVLGMLILNDILSHWVFGKVCIK